MKLRFGRILVLLAGLSAAMFASSVQGQVDTNSYFFIAHAAPGRMHVSGGNPAFPIDIKLNGTCIVKGESFGDILGPFTAPAGTFSFEVSVANSVNPCSNPTIFTGSNPFSAGVTYLGVLTLDSSNNLEGQIFTADLSSVRVGTSRLLVANATQEDLTASLTQGKLTQTATVKKATLANFNPGAAFSTASITSGGTTETGPVFVSLLSRNVYFFVIAGSTSNSSIQLLGPKAIWDVF